MTKKTEQTVAVIREMVRDRTIQNREDLHNEEYRQQNIALSHCLEIISRVDEKKIAEIVCTVIDKCVECTPYTERCPVAQAIVESLLGEEGK